MKLKSGTWIGGGYGTSQSQLRSYSDGYPEDQDLFLATTVAVNPRTGAFELGDDGNVEVGAGGVLVRWEEVENLEFIDA